MPHNEVFPTYTLGLDIGNASVGAALLGQDRILGLHVRTFDRAETAKDGESLNKIRRDARSARRRLYRRAQRLLRLTRLFKRQGLIDDASPLAFLNSTSPWELRAAGLDRVLTSQEWAAVLYHIVKHRGFQSNRKSEIKSDEKAGEMLSGVSRNQQLLKESGYRTMGELAARHPIFAEAKRNKGGSYIHTFARADLAEEMRVLFERQKGFGNPNTAQGFEQAVHALLMQRRPTLSGANLLKMVGYCTFEPEENRAPKASYTAERFIWLTKLNNLRVSGQGETRGLSAEERVIVSEMPYGLSKLTYKQLRRAIDLNENLRFIGLRYANGAKKDPEEVPLYEAKAFHAMRKAYEGVGLSLEWQRDRQSSDRLDTLAYALTVFKDDNEARLWLSEQGVEAAITEAVLGIPVSEFVRLSIKALRKILPYMEAGSRYDEAVQAAGYAHHSQLSNVQKTHYLPRFSRYQFTNPVVARSLNQARKLVNAIVREYGPPNEVHIELARDLSKSLDERREIEKEQKVFRESKEKDRALFEEAFGFLPRKDWLTKWRLYREQNGQCAYSQKPLVPNGRVDRLFDDGQSEIDHALPYSRSFADGMNNKVLVLAEENRNKGNQTPFEYLDGAADSQRWRAFVAWVEGNHAYREAKRRNLLRKDFGIEAASEFRERHLTDTRYIAKEFKRMVESFLKLSEGAEAQRCVVVTGQLTAYLRTRWGLLKVREEGDRHHAMDAAVVAACSHAMVKRLSDYSRRGELQYARGKYFDPESGEVVDLEEMRRLEVQFPQPWTNFREELTAWLSDDPPQHLARLGHYTSEQAEAVRPVRVSRAPTRRGLGAAHQDTIRSAKWMNEQKSAIKTRLIDLTLSDLPNIVGYGDPRNRGLIEAIEARLKAHGDIGKKAFQEPLYKPSASGKHAPVIRTVSLLSIQKSGLLVRNGVANNGDMVRADIFTDGKRFYAVPIYVSDAVKSELPNRAVVAYKPENEWTLMDERHNFLFSLHPNDWIKVIFKTDPSKEGYYSGLNRATGAISLWVHDRRRSVGRNGFFDGIGIKTAVAVEKYHVDLLGRLHKVHHELRQPLSVKPQV